MRLSLIACVAVCALSLAGGAWSQDRQPVLIINFLNETVTLRFDDGQTCTMKPNSQQGECTVNLPPGAHEVKVAGKSYTIQVTAEGNEFWLTPRGINRQ